jgi:MYXO-CTERM domain-containing protein
MPSIRGQVKTAGLASNRKTFALVAALLALTSARQAHAQATLVTGLGGPVGFGTSCMPPNDDGSWPPPLPDGTEPGLDLTPAFPSGLHFYSGSYTTAWINNNGNVSFKGALSTYTPNAFPGAPEPMIAPYWADVDTRQGAECLDPNYPNGAGYPAGATCTSGPEYSSAPTTNGVWWSLAPGRMVVTWDQVGYFACHPTPVMSFQMILTAVTACSSAGDAGAEAGATGIDFDIQFRYNLCGWEAGDMSGGTGGFCPGGPGCTPAQAGFDSAEVPDTDYASLPMSLKSGISTELCTQSNLTPPQPGVWQFLVRDGQILCPSAGQPCQTGEPGICGVGRLTCGVNGTTSCQSFTGPKPSQCNGLDNNCDGKIDTGPCPPGTVCNGAECVPGCVERGCGAGQICSAGVCVAADCVNVTCPSGEYCVHGSCVDACSGVTCPVGQVCRVGSCVDPCAGLNCSTGAVCEDGACIPACPCTACTSSQTCEMSGPQTGQCVPTDCAAVTCLAGEVCQSGSCISACTGAVCPSGEICQTGKCVQSTPDDAGSGAVINVPDAGTTYPPDGGVETAPPDGGAGRSGFASSGATNRGCGCRTTHTSERGGVAAGVGVAIAAMVIRRRRKR